MGLISRVSSRTYRIMSKRPLLLDHPPQLQDLPKGMNAKLLKFIESEDCKKIVGLKSTLKTLQTAEDLKTIEAVFVDQEQTLDAVAEIILLMCHELKIPVARVYQLSVRLSTSLKIKSASVITVSTSLPDGLSLPQLKTQSKPEYKIPKIVKVEKTKPETRPSVGFKN